MALRLLKYLILFLTLCNIPDFLVRYSNPKISSAASYLTSFALLAFFVFVKQRQKPPLTFILFTILYFLISGLNYVGDELYFLKEFLRLLIVVTCIIEVMSRTNYEELFNIFLIGAISIIVNAFIFPYANAMYGLVLGRFSGFFLNPNLAGIVCLLGMSISYSIKNLPWRLIGQITFTLAGMLTLSRTFILVWTIINLIAIVKNRKNLLVPLIGGIAFLLIITFSERKMFATDRFDALTSLFSEGQVEANSIGNKGRTHTWAMYYDLVFEKPFMGHGYQSFQVMTSKLPGVHNTYLLIFGESGFIPFIIFFLTYIYLLKYCLKYFKKEPYLLYILIVVLLNMMASHGYFANYQSIAMSIFILSKIRKIKMEEEIQSNNFEVTKC